MKINYNNRRFRVQSTSSGGDVSAGLVFHYVQSEGILSCNYEGEGIIKGSILGIVREDGTLHFAYQQINGEGVLRTGICDSTPEILEDGSIRLHEEWHWTNGDLSSGSSIIEEIK